MFVSCKSGEGLLLKDIQVPESIKASVCKGKFLEGCFPKLLLPRLSLGAPATSPVSAQGSTALVGLTTTKTRIGLQLRCLATQAFPVLLL